MRQIYLTVVFFISFCGSAYTSEIYNGSYLNCTTEMPGVVRMRFEITEIDLFSPVKKGKARVFLKVAEQLRIFTASATATLDIPRTPNKATPRELYEEVTCVGHYTGLLGFYKLKGGKGWGDYSVGLPWKDNPWYKIHFTIEEETSP